MTDPREDYDSSQAKGPLATLYLTQDEIDVLAIHLAMAVDPRYTARDAHAAARIIWKCITIRGMTSHGYLGSLATMLSEARTSLERQGSWRAGPTDGP